MSGRRLSATARREQLLDIAADLLQTGGIDSLTMEALGKQAGTSKTLGYAYFDNVDHVVVSLRQRELRDLYQRVERAAEQATNFEERLSAAMHAYFDSVEERGLLLYQLEQFVSARQIDVAGTDDTNEFLRWLASLIADEFGTGPEWSFACAALVGQNANAHTAIWMLSGRPRAEIERFAVQFLLGGLRAAVAIDASGP